MFSNKHINLFVLILFLVTLVGSFESASSSNIFRRQDAGNDTDTSGSGNSDIKKLCKGFKFENAFVQVKNGETITVTWSKGASKVESVINCEMYGEAEANSVTFFKQIWLGDVKFVDGLTAVSALVKFEVPPGAKLPQSILLRTWGTTSEGPHCTTYT
ncbi:11184_t:CDS:2 [Funneliformis geosporum]|nr:11184_t:CDS:2 [Funneliformis geosporum]